MAWLSIPDDNVPPHNQSGIDRSIESLGLTTTNVHLPWAPKRQRLSFCISITSLDIHGIFVSSLCFWIDKEMCQKNQAGNGSRSPQNNAYTGPSWVQLQLTRFCKSTLVNLSASSHKPEIHLCPLGISLPFLTGGKPENVQPISSITIHFDSFRRIWISYHVSNTAEAKCKCTNIFVEKGKMKKPTTPQDAECVLHNGMSNTDLQEVPV